MRVCQRRGCEMPLLNKGCSAYFCLIWKPVRMDCRVDRDLIVQPQTARDGHRKVLPHFPMFHSPFPLSTDSVPFGPRTQSLSIVRRSITLHAGTSCKALSGFDQRSVGISDRSVVRSKIVDADRAESSVRSWTLPVGSKASFSFSLEREQSAGETVHRCRHTGGIRVRHSFASPQLDWPGWRN